VTVKTNNDTTKESIDFQPCNGCGRTHLGTCRYNNHPDFNRDSTVSWKDSPSGKQWAERGEQVLPVQKTLSGKSWEFPKAPNKSTDNKGDSKGRYQKGNHLIPCDDDLCSLTKAFESNDPHNNTNFNVCVIQGQRNRKDEFLLAQAFLDTGALQNDYISEELARRLSNIGFNIINNNNNDNNKHMICTPFGNCETSHGQMTIPLRLLPQTKDCSTCHNKVLIKNDTNSISDVTSSLHNGISMVVNAIIINMPRYDLILGRNTIMASNLLDSWRQYLSPSTVCHCAKTSGEGVASHGLESSRSPNVSQPTESILAALYTKQLSEGQYKRESMQNYLSYDGEEVDEIDFPSENAFSFEDMHSSVHLPSNSLNEPPLDEYLLVHLFGSDSLQQRLMELCREYQDIFSSKLKVETADLPPFKLSCDVSKWESLTSNKLAPRVQSAKKQAETIRQIQELLNKKVISPCNVSSYSQILLVPKPDNKWRFCVDHTGI